MCFVNARRFRALSSQRRAIVSAAPCRGARDQLARFEHVLAGAGAEVFDGDGSLALRAGDHDLGSRGDERRHRIGGGRGVAQVAGPGGAALDLGRADQVGGFRESGPERTNFVVLIDLGRRHRGADPQAVRIEPNRRQSGDPLHVDEERRRAGAQSHLDEESDSDCESA